MAASKETQLAVLKRRETVASLYLQGVPQFRIAAHLKVSQATVSLDLKALQAEWLAATVRDLDAAKARELAKWDRLETVAWEAWERSLGEGQVRERQVTKGRTGKDGESLPDLVKATRRTLRGFGDPRYLERIAQCIVERSRLLGLVGKDQLPGQEAVNPWQGLVEALRSGSGPTEAEVLEGHIVESKPAALPAPPPGDRNGEHQPPAEEQ